MISHPLQLRCVTCDYWRGEWQTGPGGQIRIPCSRSRPLTTEEWRERRERVELIGEDLSEADRKFRCHPTRYEVRNAQLQKFTLGDDERLGGFGLTCFRCGTLLGEWLSRDGGRIRLRCHHRSCRHHLVFHYLTGCYRVELLPLDALDPRPRRRFTWNGLLWEPS